jgi:spectrin beta
MDKYRRESGEFLDWVRLQLPSARSVDTGLDYEHWELLFSRFQDFKLRVQAGEDKFSACESLAKRLQALLKDKSEIEEVSAIQAKLTGEWRDLITAIEERDATLETVGETHRFNIDMHKYRRESGEFLDRVRLQLPSARSVDAGRDYEDWELLVARFQEFKLRVQAGEDKFSACESLAKQLEAAYKDKSEVKEVSAIQAKLTREWRDLITAIEERDAALEAAGEIHRFNIDITEALSRIREKGASLENTKITSIEDTLNIFSFFSKM